MAKRLLLTLACTSIFSTIPTAVDATQTRPEVEVEQKCDREFNGSIAKKLISIAASEERIESCFSTLLIQSYNLRSYLWQEIVALFLGKNTNNWVWSLGKHSNSDRTQAETSSQASFKQPSALLTAQAPQPLQPVFRHQLVTPKIVDGVPQPIVDRRGKLTHPAPYTREITSPFGWRRRPYSGAMQFHQGIDYAAPIGSPVVAAGDGVVIEVVTGCLDFGYRGCGGQLGNWIEIDHGNGVVTTYGHLRQESVSVTKGARVSRGQKIGAVGSSGWSTGAHLDFRINVNGDYKDPEDFVI